MIRIAALNDASVGTNTGESPGEVLSTREAQEQAALTLYNQALQLQSDGRLVEAETTFKELLDIALLRQVCCDVEDDDEDGAGESCRMKPGTQQSRLLKYSALKNLANISTKNGDHVKAMEFYLDATALDSSDVTVWYRTGKTALELKNYPLAKLAFLEGIGCNANHWPCVDNLITVLYVLSNYHSCLNYIAQSLERNAYYVKGLAFRDQIFREQPDIRRETENLFANCDPHIHSAAYDAAKGKKYIEEALEMRRIRHELSRPQPRPILKFTRPLVSKTWKDVGECLVLLYDFVKASERPISLTCHVDIKMHLACDVAADGSRKVESEVAGVGVEKTKSGTSAANTSGSNSVSNEAGVETLTSNDVKEQPVSEDVGCNVDVEDGHSLSQGENIAICESISAGARRGRKRRSFYWDCIDAASKRRSPRVRNTGTKKQPEYVNYYKLFQNFLPSSFLGKSEEVTAPNSDEQNRGSELAAEVDHKSAVAVHDVSAAASVPCKLEEGESGDVQAFLESVCVNIGVLDIMYKYLIALGRKQSTIWPLGLADVFVDVYDRWRSHAALPVIFSGFIDEQEMRDEGTVVLIAYEFKIDKWLEMSPKISGTSSPSLAARMFSPTQALVDLSSPRFMEDLNYLLNFTDDDWLRGAEHVEFAARVWLLRARGMMLQNKKELAVGCLEEIVVLLTDKNMSCSDSSAANIMIVNCKVENVISLAQTQKQVEMLQECQSLELLHRYYESGDYQQVVDLLVPTFAKDQSSSKKKDTSHGNNVPERHSQLLLLQDALFNLGDLKECFCWGEASFHEALLGYDVSEMGSDSRLDWASTVTQLLSKLELCVSSEPSIIHGPPAVKLRRFVKNLIHLIHMQMQMDFSLESSSAVDGLAIKTVISWILLYHAIRQEELKIRSLMLQARTVNATNTERDAGVFKDIDSVMPSSMMLLFTAHEHLGRCGWCCQSDGVLLLLSAELFVSELHKSPPGNVHPFKEDLEVNAEQCFFCLYGHPNRKTKAKHLQEHSANSQVSLNWQRAKPLFDYFKPGQLPEFDSYKVSTISSEIEYLLRRILTLVPADEDPAPRMDAMCAYIEGNVADLPSFDVDLGTKPITCELYYLLADYYFKNKEQGKAIKFYLLDVCVKPDRFDSWAGMALARSSQLEQKLSSCDLRNEGPICRRATAAFRCFKQALELNPAVASLWIENGSLAYMLHSYTSRQLKQRVQLNFSEETVQTLLSKREEMLKIARHCFKSANNCEEGAEEEWLHHYMLGKIAEKMNRPPSEYLAHYKMAAAALHEEGASYPTRIQYHSPPHLALEALEVYYRTHASILKYLQQHEGRSLGEADLIEQMEQRLREIADEPFIKFQEKRHSVQSHSDSEPGCAPAAEESSKKSLKSSPVSNDHDYFRRKRKSSSTEDLTAESSDSQDSAAVKGLLNSIVSVVSERHAAAAAAVSTKSSQGATGTIVVGDAKVHRSSNKSLQPLPKKESGPSPIKEEVLSPDIEIIEETGVRDHRELVQRCIDALEQCLQRFPQHYKSLYRLSHYYATTKYHKNIQWSYDYLVGPKASWQQCSYMPTAGLFAERKNSNFFSGIWRIPIDEIDRPGSFASHMFRSISLLIRILEETRSQFLLVQITAQLHRDPDAGKKFLRDADRLHLARLAYDRTVKTLLRRMRALCRVDADADPLAQPSAIRHMLDTYRAWQTLQKVVIDPQAINALLEKAYLIMKRSRVDDRISCFDQAVRFCQQQMLISKISRMPSSGFILSANTDAKMTSFGIRSDNYVRTADTSTKGKSQHSGLGTFREREDSNHPYRAAAITSTAASAKTMTTTSGGASGSRPSGIGSSPASHVLSSPSLLTADVQSKIKSLDPIVEPFRIMHQAASQQMSGFQLEFLRQITANLLPPPPPPPPQTTPSTNMPRK